MKKFALVSTLALFSFGLASAPALAEDKPSGILTEEKSNLSYYQMSIMGLLTVIAILLGLALTQLSAVKAGIEKIASK